MKEINIAKVLIAKRKEKNVTQDELACYIGVSKASVSKWETGQSYPDITFLPQLAAYFNISIDELIDYSPQMTKEDIKKLYHSLAASFGKQPFDEVMVQCRSIIKKYYSCFPLLFQMSALLVNHCMLATEKEKQEAILNEAMDLCLRIKRESEDVLLSRQANSLEAMCLLVLQRPQDVLGLLDESMKAKSDDDYLLANAYLMTGNLPKCSEVIQISLYGHILAIISSAPFLLLTSGADTGKLEEITRRVLGLIDLFKVERLNANVVVLFYLSIAQCYMQSSTDKALDALQKYTDICLDRFFPYTLHGDDFFDSIDPWLADLDLGTEAPREEKFIKESMVQALTANPAFAPLYEHPRYKNIVKHLKEKLGV